MKMENEKTIYRIWDNVEKSFVGNNWTTREAAEEQKDALLAQGMYPDRPHTVYQIRKFKSQRHLS